MAAKYYSTLTSDLGKHYQLKMAQRLTSSKPSMAGSMSFSELCQISSKDSVETLGRLLGLRRQEIFRAEQEQALSLVGIKKRSRSERNSNESKLANKRAEQRELLLMRQLQEGRSAVQTPRWKSGGGMTVFHRGRCVYDPKTIGANTPGPAGYDTFRLPKSMRKISGGSSFGASKTQRTTFKVRKNGKSAQHRTMSRSKSRASSPPRRESQSRASSSRKKYMVSTGPRTTPAGWLTAIDAAPVRETSLRWASPGPRYNVREKLTNTAHPGRAGRGPKFSKSSRPPIYQTNEGPGPCYKPSYSMVRKSVSTTSLVPRRTSGAQSEGPGPIYYPRYDNKGHFRATPAYSFADYSKRTFTNSRGSSRQNEHTSRASTPQTQSRVEEQVSQTEDEIIREASIRVMRQEIWSKIRARG